MATGQILRCERLSKSIDGTLTPCSTLLASPAPLHGMALEKYQSTHSVHSLDPIVALTGNVTMIGLMHERWSMLHFLMSLFMGGRIV